MNIFYTPPELLVPVSVSYVKIFQHWEVKRKMEQVINAQKVLHESVAKADSIVETLPKVTSSTQTQEKNSNLGRPLLCTDNNDELSTYTDERYDALSRSKQPNRSNSFVLRTNRLL